MRVAINGFGRIGRAVFRIAEQSDEIDVVAINDLFDHDALAYLLTYDTVMGRFEGGVSIENGELVTRTPGRAWCVSGTRGSCPGRSFPWMRWWNPPGCSAPVNRWRCTSRRGPSARC